jgi:hypothetical protein
MSQPNHSSKSYVSSPAGRDFNQEEDTQPRRKTAEAQKVQEPTSPSEGMAYHSIPL